MKPTLELNNIQFCGRESELQQLSDLYQDAKDEKCKGPLITVISGYSGTGKSTLVLNGLQNSVQQFGGIFSSGKFDQQLSVRPYSAIVDAFTELFQKLDPQTHGSMIREALEEDDITALAELIPALHDLIPSFVKGNIDQDRQSRLEWGFARLKLSMRKILSILCTPSEPVVLFFDDLQWSDMGTIDIIKDFSSELQAKGCIIVLSYRDNEVHEKHPLKTKVLRHLDPEHCTKIHISNLPHESVRQLVSVVMCSAPKAIQPLADVVLSKTHGNVFFVIQLLKSLEERGLLFYDRLNFRWEWDIERINKNINISENVVDLVVRRIDRLDKELKTILVVGACLSRWLDLDSLSYILSNGDFIEFSTPPTSEDIKRLLNKAVDEHLIHAESDTRYRFSHDRIQQGAYLLLPGETERMRLHLKIGKLLLELYQSAQCQEWIFLVAVDQLDRGASLIDQSHERMELARLNLKVAQNLSAKSAFVATADYLKKGIDLACKGNTKWETDYDLCLELHNFAVEMEYCCGNFDRCREIIDVVEKRSQSLCGKLRAYFTLYYILGTQKKFAESLSLGRNVLLQLGVSWPKKARLHHVLIERSRVIRVLKGMTDDDIRSLPIITEETKLATLKMFTALVVHTWWAGDELQVTLLCLRLLRFILTEGLSDLAGVVFTYYAFISVAFKDIESARRFKDLALWATKKFDATGQECAITTLLHAFVFYHTNPTTHTLDGFLHGYRCGLKTGDVDFSFMAAGNYIVMYFYSGLPLPVLVEDAEGYIAQMKEYNQETILTCSSIYHQCALNLMGRSDDPLKLQGEALDYDKLTPEEMENPRTHQAIHLTRLQLSLYFHDWKQLHISAKALATYKDYQWPVFWCPMHCFYLGLAWYALARKTGKRVYKNSALHATKTMEKWVKWGMTSAYHLLSVLAAEKEALNGIVGRTKDAYDRAIRTAARSGFTQIEALVNERCGLFFFEKCDTEWATFYLNRSQLLYQDWGAVAKADDMKRTYYFMKMRQKRSSMLRTNIKGSSQFSTLSVEEHKNQDLIGLSNVKSSSNMTFYTNRFLKKNTTA